MNKIFISYSHEPLKFKKLTHRFADKLIELGLPIVIDKYDLRYGHNVDQFMKDIANVDLYNYILVICTTEYKARADLHVGSVGKEAIELRKLIKDNPFQEKVIPVIIEESKNPKSLLPDFFPENTFYSDLSKEFNFDKIETQKLVEHIRGVRPLKPKLSELETLVSYALSEYPGLPKELIGKTKQNTDDLIYNYCRDSYVKMLELGIWLNLSKEIESIEKIYTDLQYFSDYIPDIDLVIRIYLLLWELKDKDMSHSPISALSIIESAIAFSDKKKSDPQFPYLRLILNYRKAVSLHRQNRFEEALSLYEELMLESSQKILDSDPLIFFNAALYATKIYKYIGKLFEANSLFRDVIKSCEAAFNVILPESLQRELQKIYYCALWSLTERNNDEEKSILELEKIVDLDFLNYKTFCKSHYPTLFGLPIILIPDV
ncbi:MAG: hypothetical protein A2X18_09535 [Bacteroidetes bacterium GWF2_40_14]|nr:MAG: hypothetical protein A2X18_09535 [Bacteroidetes bacterium GWF2_40_14]